MSEIWEDRTSLELPEDISLIRDTVRTFAREKVAPIAAKIDSEHLYPKEIISELGALGFLGALIPEEFGGTALSQVAYALIIEELAVECASTSIIVSAHSSLCSWPIVNYGTIEQKKNYLPQLAQGAKIGCFALSEPGCGSDAASLTTIYKEKEGKIILNGCKNWITNAPEAGICIVFATSDVAAGHKGVTAFVHRLPFPGVTIGKKEDKLGICGSPTASITYQDVVLSEENILGGRGAGFKVAMSTLNGGRIGVAAQAVGIARASLRDSLIYARERKSFGKAIGYHQSIQNYLADMNIKVDASRHLTMTAAQLKDRGMEYGREAAMAKLFASEAAVDCALKCIQIHGGYGYVKDYPAERHLRDAKITEIYEGTSEIQRIVIATDLMKMGGNSGGNR